ncbi:MAG TPA: tRNA (adenosine(37)-N6)-threonylcarbamoyltransferase complex transferase subunit TsaD [Mariprofundaceae bacterium]|nr:tRNA (adenosine(37)-N6)-threonylcarbamoyltransferase complex transferase subunit TsaD [Mariprofundaceae bacterium]
MRVMGIETSCDETAVAIYEGRNRGGGILAERIASQVDIHARFGGIVPEIASREHLAALPVMVDQVMQEAVLDWPDVDTIAVTAGPGLMGALLVGISYARAVGRVNDIPVLPIHHMEGHLFAPGLTNELPPFPFITLLVSGGHTMLIRVEALGRYRLLGQTVDDAAGECFDKSARLLGLPYPGGPAIAELAVGGDAGAIALPRPMLRGNNLNFSFSGLKTAVLHAASALDGADEQGRRNLAAGVQQAISDVLVGKAMRACRAQKVSDLVVAGGVAANRRIRSQLLDAASEAAVCVHLPEPAYCTDNGAMIAYTGFLHRQSGRSAPHHWDAAPRWSLSSMSDG